jgi:hypothetical protein
MSALACGAVQNRSSDNPPGGGATRAFDTATRSSLKHYFANHMKHLDRVLHIEVPRARKNGNALEALGITRGELCLRVVLTRRDASSLPCRR